ncbi:hemerythrin domain-containing protein [Streptomyces sp. TRM76323]|uniref:Hemerythrin domain-containing protein n=1 Tax=Streptomyces tamarix TaxID=3078565 RepID=A0ABU3QRN3_9ACTN|nr:hemerythrin domain-containing protein [Streptomyces tamarix]MDT9685404.1 hemerythrin domain-containing protein [Streptomyces tamarix]
MPLSLTQQSVEELGGRSSVLVRQRRDHAELDRLMNLYRADGRTEEERRRTLKDIVQLTFSHAFAEETVLWPALRRLAPDGEALTARVEEEHQEINDLVAEIERTGPADPRRDVLVERAFALIRQDIRDEEDLLLPRLQEALRHDPKHLRALGTAWEAVRRTAPTHPHPAVPRRPPGNALAGVPLSALDRVRDALPAGARAVLGRTVATLAAAAVSRWRAVDRSRRGR